MDQKWVTLVRIDRHNILKIHPQKFGGSQKVDVKNLRSSQEKERVR